MASGNKNRNKSSNKTAAATVPVGVITTETELDPQGQVDESQDRTGPGRPLGSPNRDYAVGIATAPRCIKCDGTKFSSRNFVIARLYNGLSPHDKKPYNRVSHYTHRCMNPKCQQWNKLILYQLVPDDEGAEQEESPTIRIDNPAAPDVFSEEHEDEDEDDNDDVVEVIDSIFDLDAILAEESGT